MRYRLSGSGIGRCALEILVIGHQADSRSAGLEEYIEGLSFLHYLENGTLISLKEVQETLSEKETGQSVRLS